MLKDGFSQKRLGSVGCMLLATLLLSGGVVIRGNFALDKAWCLMFVVTAYFFVLIFEFEYERVHGNLGGDTQSSLRFPAIGYLVGCAVTTGYMFLPEFYRPVMILAVIMSALANARLALASGLFWCVMLEMDKLDSPHELLANLLVILMSTGIFVTFREKKYRLHSCILQFSLSVLVPAVFYYWRWDSITLPYYGYLSALGLLAAVGAYFCFDLLSGAAVEELPVVYDHLVDRDYSRVQELLKYSPSDYEHARTVSNLARECAKEIGIDSGLCEAAGFYYRMGRWVGEPYIENGVKRAKQLCFPLPLQQVLAEFGGEELAISSKESALIHMVDTLVYEGESMEARMGDDNWNRDKLVNQTLNEHSAKGLYDQSGMSINEFLKVREFLLRAIHDDSEEERQRDKSAESGDGGMDRSGLKEDRTRDDRIHEDKMHDPRFREPEVQDRSFQGDAVRERNYREDAVREPGYYEEVVRERDYGEDAVHEPGFYEGERRKSGSWKTAGNEMRNGAGGLTGFEEEPMDGPGYQEHAVHESGYYEDAVHAPGSYEGERRKSGSWKTAGNEMRNGAGRLSGFQEDPMRGTGVREDPMRGTEVREDPMHGTGFREDPTRGFGFQEDPMRGTGVREDSMRGTRFRDTEKKPLTIESLRAQFQPRSAGIVRNGSTNSIDVTVQNEEPSSLKGREETDPEEAQRIGESFPDRQDSATGGTGGFDSQLQNPVEKGDDRGRFGDSPKERIQENGEAKTERTAEEWRTYWEKEQAMELEDELTRAILRERGKDK